MGGAGAGIEVITGVAITTSGGRPPPNSAPGSLMGVGEGAGEGEGEGAGGVRGIFISFGVRVTLGVLWLPVSNCGKTKGVITPFSGGVISKVRIFPG